MIVLNIVDKLLQKITTVVYLQQGCVLLLIRVDASYLLLAVTLAAIMMDHDIRVAFARRLLVEEIVRWRLHFLIKVKYLDNVGLLPVAGVSRMLSLLSLLIAEEIVASLVAIGKVVLSSLFLVAAWDAVLNDRSDPWVLGA